MGGSAPVGYGEAMPATPAPIEVEERNEFAPEDLPPGYRLRLPGRGTTFVRYLPGPSDDAPTVLLLHGWIATAALNWHVAFGPLAPHFRVVAPDMRGHGQGIRSPRRFRITDVADDVAAVIEQQDLGPVIAVGYSLGGPVAQMLWRRHPHLVQGLVLCATGAEFLTGNRERYVMAAFMSAAAGTTRLSTVAHFVPGLIAKRVLGIDYGEGRPGAAAQWARKEMSGHSVRMLLEAGLAISTYSAKDWVHEIDVPTSVIVTENDNAVSPQAQLRLAMAIPGAHINRIPDGHTGCMNPDFGRKVADACHDVHNRVNLGYHPLAPVASLDRERRRRSGSGSG